MKFVKDVKARLKHYSTIALATGTGIQGAWMAFPDDLKAGLGPDAIHWVSRLTAFVLLAGIVGKFIDQGGKDGTP
jgi:hypothetical protein